MASPQPAPADPCIEYANGHARNRQWLSRRSDVLRVASYFTVLRPDRPAPQSIRADDMGLPASRETCCRLTCRTFNS